MNLDNNNNNANLGHVNGPQVAFKSTLPIQAISNIRFRYFDEPKEKPPDTINAMQNSIVGMSSTSSVQEPKEANKSDGNGPSLGDEVTGMQLEEVGDA